MLLRTDDCGLYCEAGDFYVDPWKPVDRAVITHAHGDHARWGSRRYLASREGEHVLRARLGPDASLQCVEYGEAVTVNGVRVSLHPAGHILGSAQVRVEHRGDVWVVSGDYKTEGDATCTPFELVRCSTFITESTFGLPIYRWDAQRDAVAEIEAWWRENQARGRASLLLAYSLGKAQRLLHAIDTSIGPVYAHGAVEAINRAYRASGIPLPPTSYASAAPRDTDWSRALILAPPMAMGTPWLRRFGALSTAFASGWMRIRGTRRRRGVDRGFVVSDHVDWPALLETIDATGAEHVGVTHGNRETVVRWLREHGRHAWVIASAWEGETGEAEATAEEVDAAELAEKEVDAGLADGSAADERDGA